VGPLSLAMVGQFSLALRKNIFSAKKYADRTSVRTYSADAKSLESDEY
jgi:hypothetical protein